MKPVQWRVPAGTDPRKFREALTLAHSAAQWLARLANSYLAPQPQHQQLLLAFDPQRHAFVSQVFINDLSVELRLPQIEMQFREGSHLVPHVLDVEGRSSAQIEAWVLVELLHRGIDRARFSKQLPYGAANLMSGDSLEYSPKACADGLAALSDWFGNAAIVLEKIAERHAGQGAVPRLICWPETFQLGTVIADDPKGHTDERAVRVGFSPGDERNPGPNFFVAKQSRGVLTVPSPGAVVTGDRIIAEKLSADQVAAELEAMIAAAPQRKAG